jgi:hypothetical protein
MVGHPLRVVKDAAECQAHCRNITGCAHFSFWKLGRHCHVAGPRAIAESGVFFQSGPPKCEDEDGDADQTEHSTTSPAKEHSTTSPEEHSTLVRTLQKSVRRNWVRNRQILGNEAKADLVQRKFQGNSWSAPLTSSPKLCMSFVIGGLAIIAVASATRLFQTIRCSLRRRSHSRGMPPRTSRRMEGVSRSRIESRAFSLLHTSPPSSSEASDEESEFPGVPREAQGRPRQLEVDPL